MTDLKYEQRLQKDEELDLSRQMIQLRDSGIELYFVIRNLIASNNFWVVGSIAKKFAHKTRDIDFDEMFNSGCLALLEALEKFDPSYNVRVCTYAYPRIFMAIWDLIITYRCGITVSKSLYKKVCSHLKNPKMTDAEFAQQNRLSLMELQNLITITKIGIPVLSSFEVELEDSTGEKGNIESFLAESSVITGSGFTYAESGERDIEINRLELKIIGDKVDEYCQKHLTQKQYAVIKLIIVPYLRGEEYCTFTEAAEKLGKSVQAVDQILDYSRIKLVQSEKGLEIKQIIWHVMDCIKFKRSVKVKDNVLIM